MYLSNHCEGCKESSEDLSVLMCGFYCKTCIEKLVENLDTNSNEFHCFFCEETHKIPGKGFKRVHATYDDEKITEKFRIDDIYRSDLVEQLKVNLKDIKETIDKMKFNLNNPIDIIKEHCVKQRNQVDLRVEELIKEINDLRDGFLNEIDAFEKESIESLDINSVNSKHVQDFLTETNEFYVKWDSYLTNFKISDEEVKKANEMAKICKNKMPIYKKKIMSLIFHENILYLKKDMDGLLYARLGFIGRSLIEKKDFKNIKAECYGTIEFIYEIQYFCDETILMDYASEENDLILEIRDGNMTSKVIKIIGLDESTYKHTLCVMGKFVIFHYVDNSCKYLVKFDKDLVEVKRIELQYKIQNMQATENLIYALVSDSNCEIRVINGEFITLQILGQTECPKSPFYLTNEVAILFTFLLHV